VSEKALPSGLKDDGLALTVPPLVSMTILSLVNELMEPLAPVAVAEEPKKLAVPKLANGRTLQVLKQLDGASATHSAEVLVAVVELCVVA